MQEAEIDEGSKWLKYSDLYMAKSRAVEKVCNESKEVQKIDKEIKKEILGIHESLIKIKRCCFRFRPTCKCS